MSAKKIKINPKQKRVILIASIVLAVGLVVFFALRKKKQAGAGTNPGTDDLESQFPVGFGSDGAVVEDIQRYIISKGGSLPKYGVDGKFRTETETALFAITGKKSVTYAEYLNMVETLK